MRDALPDTTPEVANEHPSLFHFLERSDRFRRDTRLGGILHRGKLSLREVSPNDSLHVVIHGNRLSAHVDEICPLDCTVQGRTRYSLTRVVAHNLSDVLAALARRIRGRGRGNHCHLECEVVWVDDAEPHEVCTAVGVTVHGKGGGHGACAEGGGPEVSRGGAGSSSEKMAAEAAAG